MFEIAEDRKEDERSGDVIRKKEAEQKCIKKKDPVLIMKHVG